MLLQNLAHRPIIRSSHFSQWSFHFLRRFDGSEPLSLSPMSNPFDSTVDEGYNPFAGGYADDPPPAPVPPAPDPSPTYSPAHFQDPEPLPTAAPAKEKKGIISALVGDKFVDPVTGVPISERDIERREEALAKRERELQTMEDQVRSGT
jgi:hypothetical protein